MAQEKTMNLQMFCDEQAFGNAQKPKRGVNFSAIVDFVVTFLLVLAHALNLHTCACPNKRRNPSWKPFVDVYFSEFRNLLCRFSIIFIYFPCISNFHLLFLNLPKQLLSK